MLYLLVLVGCGKELNPDFCAANRDDERCTRIDARVSPDGNSDGPPIDAPMATRIYVSTTSGELHAVDPATMATQLIGTVDGAPSLDGISFGVDGNLVAITGDDDLLRIDPTDASVLSSVNMAENHEYWGLTVVPAGELGPSAKILAATNDTASLYEVNTDGSLTLIGPFGNSLSVAGDIAWVPGVGLFASVDGNNCSGTCIASVSATTGAATMLAMTGPGDMWALAAFNGELWAVGGSSDAYRVNQTSGVPSSQFSTSISGVADAAP